MATLAERSIDFQPRCAVPSVPVWQLSVEQYHEMARAGILREDDPVELLDGWLAAKMIRNAPHQLATELLRDALQAALPEGWHALSQGAITLPGSVPEPDGAVVRGQRRDYGGRLPDAADVALVVEVADSSLKSDRTLKKRLYAQVGIPVYWIVNLVDRRVEVYTSPASESSPADYSDHRDYLPSESVPVVLGHHEVARIAVAEILP
jgi:Uma2 family endonuclease